jgi:hypothetical protein
VGAGGFGPLRGEHKPEDLLAMAATAAEPATKSEPRHLDSALLRSPLKTATR